MSKLNVLFRSTMKYNLVANILVVKRILDSLYLPVVASITQCKHELLEIINGKTLGYVIKPKVTLMGNTLGSVRAVVYVKVKPRI